MTPLLQQIQALEVELRQPGVRSSRERLRELLHPEFCEVGRSGRHYTLQTVIDHLVSEKTRPKVISDGFRLVEFGLGTALLTYRSAETNSENGGLVNHALRSSFWVKTDEEWQLRYHQGTAAQQTW